MQGARELLTDFREVEYNFRQLDRRVRERIALWEGSKGALLEEIMGERDLIADSDQGRSFRAFWDFLLSSRRQEELTRSARSRACPALDCRTRARCAHPARSLRLDGSRRAYPANRGRSCRSSCGAFSMIRPGWRIAASWISCMASRARRWACARHQPSGSVMEIAETCRRHRPEHGATAVHTGDQAGDRQPGTAGGR